MDNFSNVLFPIIARIASRTISTDLVSVQPMNGLTIEQRNEILSINRDRKIESIIDDKPYQEVNLPGPCYPDSSIFYMDYKFK